MMNTISDKIKADPSEVRQEFSNINIKLLCCRYWILQTWQCFDLSVPFWRIYHNSTDGAQIHFKGQTTYLNEQTIVIIPPNTSFSTSIGNTNINGKHESIIGRKVEERDTISNSIQNRVDHLFIHFSLGFPLDFAQTGIFTVSCTSELGDLIEKIKISCIEDTHFDLLECFRIKQLINSCLLNIEENIWNVAAIDQRILVAMRTIERNFNQGISNAVLANTANMAVNSFSRLFKTNTGFSVQQYIAKTKIEFACNLMHHSHQTMDEIAYSCGFYDRHHFSKTFKRQMKVNPSYYFKNLMIS